MPEPDQFQYVDHRLAVAQPSYLPVPAGETVIDATPAGPSMDYGRLFRKYVLLGVLLIVIGVIGGFVSVILATPLYKSRVLLEVQPANRGMLRTMVQESSTDSQVDLQTQIQLLRSSRFLQQVQQRLQLEIIPPAPVRVDMFSRLRRRLGASSQDPVAIMNQGLSTAIGTFEARPINGTRILEISCDSTNPEVAASFLNTLANEYKQQNYQTRMQSAQAASQWITQQVEETKTKMLESEQRLQEYVKASGNLFVAQDNTLADSKLKDLQLRLSGAQVDRIAKQPRWDLVRNTPQDKLADVLDDADLHSRRQKLVEMRREEANLLTTLTPQNAKVKKLEGEIADLDASLQRDLASLVKRINNDYEAAVKTEELLSRAYSSQAGQVGNQAAKTSEYNALKRESETLRQTYNTMLLQANEASIASSVQTDNIQLVDPAQPAPEPYKPQAAINIGFGGLLGLALCCGIAFLREKTDRRVGSPYAARKLLNLPQLGVIPSVEEARNKWRLPGRAKSPVVDPNTLDTLAALDGTSRASDKPASSGKPLLAESFRVTLASLMRETSGSNRPQVILVTSPGPEEGKTTISSNLGMALAETGRRVLVFDGDFRRPRAHKVFGIPNTKGLFDLLAEETPVKDYPASVFGMPTSFPHLFVLPNGRRSENIAKALYSSRLREVVQRLRKEFDTVLIDAPPMLHVADARVMSEMVDGVVLVLRSGVTDRESAVEALDQLRSDGVVILGTVLNDWKPSKSQIKKYQYYSTVESLDQKGAHDK